MAGYRDLNEGFDSWLATQLRRTPPQTGPSGIIDLGETGDVRLPGEGGLRFREIPSILTDVENGLVAAVESANGKNRRYVATRDPGPEDGGTTPGDTWFTWDATATRNVVAFWVWDGSAWVKEVLGDAVLGALDVNKLVVTGTAAIDEAVIAKLAAQTVESGEFRSIVDPVTGQYSIMDSSGFRVVDSNGPNNDSGPEDLVRLGPDADKLLQLGDVVIDSGGNVSAATGSFGQLMLDGSDVNTLLRLPPRGIVGKAELYRGQYSPRFDATRGMVAGLTVTLEPGRVYRLHSSAMTVGNSQTNNPELWLHYSLDGADPKSNDIYRWGESTIGDYSGWRTLPPMEVFIDRRTATEPVSMRADVTLHRGGAGWVQVSALRGPAYLMVEDMGTGYADVGNVPTYTAPAPPAKQRYVTRWNATAWGNYFYGGGARDTSMDKPIQGRYSSHTRECFFIFPDLVPALAGATIYRITLRTYATHWANPGGGTGSWAYHGHSSLPAGGGQWAGHMTTTGGWPRNAAREINIIPQEFAAWQNGSRKGFAMSTSNTSWEFYGNFSANLADTWIEIDYEK